MKHLRPLLFLALVFATQTAFSQDSETLVKRILQGRINDIFHKWDDQWSWDKYVDESAYISSIEESSYSPDKIVASGTFTVKRFGARVKVGFTAKIKVSDSALTITNLCYQDNSANDTDCCEPSRWSLDVISK